LLFFVACSFAECTLKNCLECWTNDDGFDYCNTCDDGYSWNIMMGECSKCDYKGCEDGECNFDAHGVMLCDACKQEGEEKVFPVDMKRECMKCEFDHCQEESCFVGELGPDCDECELGYGYYNYNGVKMCKKCEITNCSSCDFDSNGIEYCYWCNNSLPYNAAKRTCEECYVENCTSGISHCAFDSKGEPYCVKSCLSNQYYNETTDKCDDCPVGLGYSKFYNSCVNCSEKYEHCTSCGDAISDDDGTIIGYTCKYCKGDYIWNEAKQICEECNLEGCNVCGFDDLGEKICRDCQPGEGYNYKNEKCDTCDEDNCDGNYVRFDQNGNCYCGKCFENYVKNPKTGKCELSSPEHCKFGYSYFDNDGKAQCTNCSYSYVAISGKCESCYEACKTNTCSVENGKIKCPSSGDSGSTGHGSGSGNSHGGSSSRSSGDRKLPHRRP